MRRVSYLTKNAFRRNSKKKPTLAPRHLGTLSNHTGTISALVFLSDKCLISSSHGGTIRVWQIEGQRQLRAMHQGSKVAAMVVSSDGSLLASGGADGTVILWSVASWTKAIVPSHKHSSSVRSMSFSADSKQLATVSDDRTVLVWSTSTGEVVAGPLEGHGSTILSVVFSPHADQLATGTEDGSIGVWNFELASLALTINLTGNPAVFVLVWLEQKQFICAAYKSIVFLDPVAGSLLYEHMNAHDDWIRSIAVYHQGRCIVTGSEDGRVILWKVLVGGPPRKLAIAYADPNEVSAVAVSPNGRYLGSGYRDHMIRLWSLILDND